MAKNKSFLEKRGQFRVRVKIPVEYQRVDDPRKLKKLRGKTAVAKNLSQGGIYIKTIKPLKTGDILRLDIIMPKKARNLFAFAEVVWADKEGSGIRLLLMPEEDKAALKAYLDKAFSQ